MMSGIWGLLAALPQLLSMINALAGWLQKVSGNDLAGFLNRSGEAFNQLSNAKTPDEHSAAAKALSDLLRGMPAK